MLVFKPLMATKTDHSEAFVTHLPLLFLILILWLSQRHQGWWLVARNVGKGEAVVVLTVVLVTVVTVVAVEKTMM